MPPKNALAMAAKSALRRRFSGAVDNRGYVSHACDNLVSGVRLDQFEPDLRKGSGQELEDKFMAVHSSSALAVNTFAWFKDQPEALEILGRRAPVSMAFERRLPIFPNRGPANLDVWLDFGDEVVAVESKLLEHLTPKVAQFADAYETLAPPEAGWWAAYQEARGGQSQYLDRAQLVKHYFGLRRHSQANRTTKRLTLAYIFWEPLNWQDFSACREHRAEVERFADQVAGASIPFEWTTYADLWLQWEGSPQLTGHVADLRARYDVEVMPVE